MELKTTPEQIRLVEEETREQRKAPSFFKHRDGRIGASGSGAVAHSNPFNYNLLRH